MLVELAVLLFHCGCFCCCCCCCCHRLSCCL